MRGRERERERERQRHRQKEKQAPCREPDLGLDPETPGSCPGPKADAQPLSHPGILVLALEPSDIARWPYRPGVFDSCRPLALPELSPADFQSETLWGLILRMRIQYRYLEGYLRLGLEPFEGGPQC